LNSVFIQKSSCLAANKRFGFNANNFIVFCFYFFHLLQYFFAVYDNNPAFAVNYDINFFLVFTSKTTRK